LLHLWWDQGRFGGWLVLIVRRAWIQGRRVDRETGDGVTIEVEGVALAWNLKALKEDLRCTRLTGEDVAGTRVGAGTPSGGCRVWRVSARRDKGAVVDRQLLCRLHQDIQLKRLRFRNSRVKLAIVIAASKQSPWWGNAVKTIAANVSGYFSAASPPLAFLFRVRC